MGCGMVTGSWFIGRHRNSKAKKAAYECGIPVLGDARSRFSVRFYMVAMLFILFDVEAVFMLPWAVIYRKLPSLGVGRFFGFWEMVVYLGFVAGRAVLHLEKGHSGLVVRQGGPVSDGDPYKRRCPVRTCRKPGDRFPARLEGGRGGRCALGPRWCSTWGRSIRRRTACCAWCWRSTARRCLKPRAGHRLPAHRH
jgi:NADH-quinone oxidoreductase subunit A